MLSVLDIFKVGIGPSSSHTVGPMRIALRAVEDARSAGVLEQVARAHVSLRGSLALTGIGHGADKASILGLSGKVPDAIDPDEADAIVAAVKAGKTLMLGAERQIAFDPARDIDLRGDIIPDLHPNEMCVTFFDARGKGLLDVTYYSVGGGFIAS